MATNATPGVSDAARPVPETPLPLLPEFSDSRDEPNGPPRVAAPDYRDLRRDPVTYYRLLDSLGDAWLAEDYGEFATWQFLTFGLWWTTGHPAPRAAP